MYTLKSIAFYSAPLFMVILWLALVGTNAQSQPVTVTVADRIRAVEKGLLPDTITAGDTTSRMSLAERMQTHKVPGVSIAVVRNYQIDWVKSYGVKDRQTQEPLDNASLFQVGSISKSLVALATLALVEQGKLTLDRDVNQYLKTWKLPDNRFSATQKVTIRRILSHSAGLVGEGYPGYSLGEAVPSLLQLLDGTPPAKSRPVRLDTVPGVRWRYSGGGYLILQQLLMDVTQQSFTTLMQSLVFKPLGMTHSTFAQPLPKSLLTKAASGYREDGELEPGRWRTIPQVAAGGLWSTATDLASFLIEIQRSNQGQSNRILPAERTGEMLKPHIRARQEYWSLGFNVGGQQPANWFMHGGLTDGYISEMIGLTNQGNGLIILTNSQSSFPLIMEIVRGVAAIYDWPAWKPQQVMK